MQWAYCPSLPAAAALTSLFGAILLAHLLQALLYRKPFCWVVCMAAAWETAGFVLRLLGARDPRRQVFSIGSNLLVILAPLWVNAFAYMLAGRMIYYWLPSKSVGRLRARTMSSWFVWLDVVTFFVQAAGGSMLENEDATQARLGLHICKCLWVSSGRRRRGSSLRSVIIVSNHGFADMGGVGLQQFFVCLFVLIMVKFHAEVRRTGHQRTTSWRRQLFSVYFALALITVRSFPHKLHSSSLSLQRSVIDSINRSASSSASSSSRPASMGPSPIMRSSSTHSRRRPWS